MNSPREAPHLRQSFATGGRGMVAAHRRRDIGIAAASLAAHAALLAALAVYAPRLRVPVFESGPPEAIIPVLIMPRTPPPTAAAGAEPTPIRLHRRPQRFVAEPAPVKPLVAPEADVRNAPTTAPGPKAVTAPTAPDALSANARNALHGRLGCANADALGLSRAEREACEKQLAAGAKSADFPGLGIDADTAAGLAAAGAQKDRDYRYKRAVGGANIGAGPSATANAPGGRVNLPGASAADIGARVGSDKPATTIPF